MVLTAWGGEFKWGKKLEGEQGEEGSNGAEAPEEDNIAEYDKHNEQEVG